MCAGGGGKLWPPGPQSEQSVPKAQSIHSEPGPPSSQKPSEAYWQGSVQRPGAGRSDGGGGGKWVCGVWLCGEWLCGEWRCGEWRCGSWLCDDDRGPQS